MLPNQFGVNWLLGLGVEAKNRFSRWLPWRPSWNLDRHDFSYIWSTSHPDASQQVWSQLAFRFRRRSEKDFQDGGHLGFPIRRILAIFLSTFHPDASYQVSSQLALGCRKSRLLKQLFTPHDACRMTHDGRRTLTDRPQWLTMRTSCSGELKIWANLAQWLQRSRQILNNFPI